MYGDGGIEFSAVAQTFAGVVTDPAAYSRQWVFSQDRLPGLFECPLGDKHFDPGDIFPHRASGAARRGLFFVSRAEKTP
jgi:hypothetical protein